MNYLYRTNGNPPTNNFMSLYDHVKDLVDSGEEDIQVIHRQVANSGDEVMDPSPYCIVKAAISEKGRRQVSTRFID